MTSTARQPIDLGGARSAAKIEKGKQAWAAIKGTAEEQRVWWIDVGNALAEGRKLHPSNQAFGKWCADAGFDMAPSTRSNAIWYAENGASCGDLKTELSHPDNIRQWHREQQAANDPAQGELKDDPPPLWEVTQEMAEKCLRAST